MITKNQVRGILIGGAIGDALGAPVETWPLSKITEIHGEPIRKYVDPIGHKWFTPEDMPAGSTTDDTQLTIATLKGLIKGHEKAMETRSFDPYMDQIALEHVAALKATPAGWGKSTIEAIRRIANGVHWSIAGKTTEENRGTGNGVPMKISAIAAWYAACGRFMFPKEFKIHQKLVDFSAMTHYSQMSAHAGIVHFDVILASIDGTTPIHKMLSVCSNIIKLFSYEKEEHLEDIGEPYTYTVSHLNPTKDNICERLDSLYYSKGDSLEVIQNKYGNGSCYVYDSLPYTYALYMKNHANPIEGIFEAINNGGDSDTNAKMIGEIIGAYQGIDVFETPENQWMIDGLREYNQLIEIADEFCECFKNS